eukprot:1213484-Pyramimonas_sp.AAC.1
MHIDIQKGGDVSARVHDIRWTPNRAHVSASALWEMGVLRGPQAVSVPAQCRTSAVWESVVRPSSSPSSFSSSSSATPPPLSFPFPRW